MRKFYRKYKCSLIIPLLLLFLINAISFILMLYHSDNCVELAVFVGSLLMIVYYSYKQFQNLRIVANLIKRKFKGEL